MSTLKVNKLRDTAGSADAITLDPNGGAVLAGVTTVTSVKVGAAVTISESGIEATGVGITCASINGGQLSNRNMVINGAMEVDQRNEGSAVTSSPGGSLNFAADRNHFYNYGTGELTATLQRVADAPAGFYNSNKVTITTPESSGGTPAADDRFSMQHRIEGRNINRLSLGTSGAKDFVISFYVKVSVAGNYGLAVQGGSNNGRSYCMLYPATTSWSRVVLKVPGDTSGTYQAGTSSGLELKFGLYNGSSRTGADQGTAGTGSWQATTAPQGTTGQYQLGGTNGATWQITGLQVEAGTEATEFEHKSHGHEMTLCQRYFFNILGNNQDYIGVSAFANSTSSLRCPISFPVPMRAMPTFEGSATSMVFDSSTDSTVFNISTLGVEKAGTTANPTRCTISCDPGGMTAGQGGQLETRADNGFLNFSAEL